MYRKLVFQAWVAIWLASILSGCINPQANAVNPILLTDTSKHMDAQKFPASTFTPVVIKILPTGTFKPVDTPKFTTKPPTPVAPPPFLPETATWAAATDTASHTLFQTPPFIPFKMVDGKSEEEIVTALFNMWLSQFIQEDVGLDLRLEEYLIIEAPIRGEMQVCATGLRAEFIAEGRLLLRPTAGQKARAWVAGGGNSTADKKWMTKSIYTAIFKTDEGYTWKIVGFNCSGQ